MSSAASEFFPDCPPPEIPVRDDQQLGARVLQLIPKLSERQPYQMSEEELTVLRARCRFPVFQDPEVKKRFFEGLSDV